MSRAGDEWRVALTVTAKKLRADSIGKEAEVPMNDLVDIGVFAEPKDGAPVDTLYFRQHRLKSGRQTLTLTMPAYSGSATVRARVDPTSRLIVRNRDRLVEILDHPR